MKIKSNSWISKIYPELENKLIEINDEMTLKELKTLLGEYELFIKAGDNCSGVDVVNLTTEEALEWTW